MSTVAPKLQDNDTVVDHSAPKPKVRTENNLDFLRLYAAFGVLIAHSCAHLKANFLWMTPSTTKYWLGGGVPLFFILSGALVYASAQRCIEKKLPISQFFLNRAARVYPALIFSAVLAALLLAAFGFLNATTIRQIPVLGHFAAYFALTPVINPAAFREFGVGVVNGSLWTIPVECSFYAIVPLLALLAVRKGNKVLIWTTSALIAVSVLVQYYVLGPAGNTTIGKILGITFLPHFVYFGTGILFGIYWQKLPKNVWLGLGAIAGYFAISILGGEMTFPITTPLLAYGAFYVGYFGPSLLNTITKTIGDLSYGLYVYHMLLVNTVIELGQRSVLSTTQMQGSVYMVVTGAFVLAWISWHFIEKPSLKIKKYSLRQPPSQA